MRNGIPEEDYIQALIKDLDADLPQATNRTLVSIFMGGGTPSLFSPQAIETVLNVVQKRFTLADDIEITLEANPGTVEYERFAGYRAAGVNRLSIGIQSFQADKLKVLGRIHNDGEAIRAAEAACKAGFSNFNLDLMHGLPQQTISDALFDLQTALSLNPTHISWYQLTIEPNTFFAHKPPVLPHDEAIWEMQEEGRKLLADHGFKQYEISAYSLEHKQCQHNKNYWEFGDYLGIGAGAHSKITNEQTVTRCWKLKNPKDYLGNEVKIGAREIVSQQELPFEFMLNALRLYSEISVAQFEQRTGLVIGTIEDKLNKAQQKELLQWDTAFIRSTELGRRFYNDLVGMFL